MMFFFAMANVDVSCLFADLDEMSGPTKTASAAIVRESIGSSLSIFSTVFFASLCLVGFVDHRPLLADESQSCH